MHNVIAVTGIVLSQQTHDQHFNTDSENSNERRTVKTRKILFVFVQKSLRIYRCLSISKWTSRMLYLNEECLAISSTMLRVGRCTMLSVICNTPLEHQTSSITTFARIRLPTTYIPGKLSETEGILLSNVIFHNYENTNRSEIHALQIPLFLTLPK